MNDGGSPTKNTTRRTPSMRPFASLPPAPWKGAWRLAFAFGWLGLQGALVVTAGRRPGTTFGLRVLSDEVVVRPTLYREVDRDGQRVRIRVDDGLWNARDAGGLMQRFAWTDRVRARELLRLGADSLAPDGEKFSVMRFQAALDDVAAHMPNDAETRRFLMDLHVRRHGRDPYVVQLASTIRRDAP